jgi:hypothetical protein
MARMLDLVKASAVPANLMQAAARGALTVPPEEMLEILVYLTGNPVFGQEAKITLAGWDPKTALRAASDSKSPQEVLDYLSAPENLRPALLPALLENPAVRVDALVQLAATGSREVALAILASSRACGTVEVLNAVHSNVNLTAEETAQIQIRLHALDADIAAELDEAPAPAGEPHADDDDEEIMQVLTAYEQEHAAEIAAEGNKPFHAIGGVFDEIEDEIEMDGPAPASTPAPANAGQRTAGAAAAPARKVKKSAPVLGERVSTLQKIANLDIKGRIHLALRGSKEDRSILVRDGTKLVALAVLQSPKIGDSEVESFASQKNVLEALLRQIPMHRRFAKNYAVVRNLVFNPRTPLDVSLGLMKHMLVNDLRHLSGNKEVSDTIRKLALKMFKQKADSSRKKAD